MNQKIQVGNSYPSTRELRGVGSMVSQAMKRWEAKRGIKPVDSSNARLLNTLP